MPTTPPSTVSILHELLSNAGVAVPPSYCAPGTSMATNPVHGYVYLGGPDGAIAVGDGGVRLLDPLADLVAVDLQDGAVLYLAERWTPEVTAVASDGQVLWEVETDDVVELQARVDMPGVLLLLGDGNFVQGLSHASEVCPPVEVPEAGGLVAGFESDVALVGEDGGVWFGGLDDGMPADQWYE